MGRIANVAYVKDFFISDMPVCSCKSHNNDNAAVYRISSKRFKKCVLQALIDKKVLNEKSTYLCTA